MASDNNLDIDSQNEIRDIDAAKASNDYRIILETDRYKTYRSSEKESRKTKRTVKIGGHLEAFMVDEKSTGDARVLQDFLKWGMEKYPAKTSMAILWGHGHGWRGCADDYSAQDSLTMQELDLALAGALKGGKLALLGFDMCQMATLEVLYEVADESELVIASQNVEPPDGWYYERLLSEPYQQPEQFGKSALRHFAEYYRERGIDSYTLSLFRSAEVKKLAQLMNELAGESQNDDSLFVEMDACRVQSLDFKYEKYVDIGALVENLLAHTDSSRVKKICANILDQLDKVIVAKVSGTRYHASRGLSVFFPEDLTGSDIKDYANISFSKAYPEWNKLLVELKRKKIPSTSI